MTAKIPSRVVIATRGSPLALWQSNWVAARLREIHPGLEVELNILKTSGDRFQEASLQVLGGKGAFTKEITEAILRGEADVAVHSLKDLPTEPVRGLRVWAHPKRFSPRDAWIGRDGLLFKDVPEGSTVATGSLRRVAQLKHHHPTVEVEQIRGNVDTRLRKFAEGSMAGMFLAMAGLERLELTHHVTEGLDPRVFLPAPGQGSLAIEGRNEETAQAILSPMNDPDTRDRVTAERALLSELEAGCQVPVAALATLEGESLVLDGLVASLNGERLLRSEKTGPRSDAESIGRTLARELIEAGGAEILETIRKELET